MTEAKTESRKIHIRSSHGLGKDEVAFVADADTGRVLEVTVDIAGFGVSLPAYFDFEEFADTYGQLEDMIDILDIGYTGVDGVHVRPDQDFRQEFRWRVMRQDYQQVLQLLQQVQPFLSQLRDTCMLDVPNPQVDLQALRETSTAVRRVVERARRRRDEVLSTPSAVAVEAPQGEQLQQ